MFGRRFFGGRFFAPAYWGDGGTETPTPPITARGGSFVIPVMRIPETDEDDMLLIIGAEFYRRLQ